MNISGKVVCGILGFLIANIPGLLIGLWLGHNVDKGMNQNFNHLFGQQAQSESQAVFFDASFAVMGHLAKADGVVTKLEIAAAEQIMQNLGIVGDKRDQAISAFNRGKSDDFDFQGCIQKLKVNCARSPSLIQMFIEIQIVAATADGKVSSLEMQILYSIGNAFGIPQTQIQRLVEMVIAQQSFRQGGAGGYNRTTQGPTLSQAFTVLGISKDANKQEIKKAYRKLMSQNHPDKLVSKGMPEEMIKVATEKSQEIQSAYELIKKQKGF